MGLQDLVAFNGLISGSINSRGKITKAEIKVFSTAATQHKSNSNTVPEPDLNDLTNLYQNSCNLSP